MRDSLPAQDLTVRVRELEGRIESLRLSRRVLINLLSVIERERREQISRLQAETRDLRRRNGLYARALLAQRCPSQEP